MHMTPNPRRQGELGEASAVQWLTWAGAVVCKPLFEAPDYDLVADWGNRIERVQVKTSICWAQDRFRVQLATRGGNQSWSRTIKYLGPDRCDRVFIHVGDGRRWYIPVSELGGQSAISLAGPKYSEFEVDRGRPLPPYDGAAPRRSTLD